MNLKNVIVCLVLLSACFAQVASAAPAVPIRATAILDTPPVYNAGAGAAHCCRKMVKARSVAAH